jgi:hypothetical protein
MATGLTALFVACVALVPWIEQRLPARAAISTSLRFREGYKPSLEDIHRFVASRGMSIPADSVSIDYDGHRFNLDCLILAQAGGQTVSLASIAFDLSELPDVASFTVAHASRA